MTTHFKFSSNIGMGIILENISNFAKRLEMSAYTTMITRNPKDDDHIPMSFGFNDNWITMEIRGKYVDVDIDDPSISSKRIRDVGTLINYINQEMTKKFKTGNFKHSLYEMASANSFRLKDEEHWPKDINYNQINRELARLPIESVTTFVDGEEEEIRMLVMKYGLQYSDEIFGHIFDGYLHDSFIDNSNFNWEKSTVPLGPIDKIEESSV